MSNSGTRGEKANADVAAALRRALGPEVAVFEFGVWGAVSSGVGECGYGRRRMCR